MIYLLNSQISNHKSILFALRNIFGLGKSISLFICKKAGFSKNLKVKDLSKLQLIKLINITQSLNLVLGLELSRTEELNFKKLLLIKSYRGLRRSQGLPVRGQRTHSNAKTARRKRY